LGPLHRVEVPVRVVVERHAARVEARRRQRQQRTARRDPVTGGGGAREGVTDHREDRGSADEGQVVAERARRGRSVAAAAPGALAARTQSASATVCAAKSCTSLPHGSLKKNPSSATGPAQPAASASARRRARSSTSGAASIES